MPSQIGFGRKFLFAFITFIWVFTSVSSHVTSQIGLGRKFRFTFITFIWLSTSLRSHMPSQIGLGRKFRLEFITFITFHHFLLHTSHTATHFLTIVYKIHYLLLISLHLSQFVVWCPYGCLNLEKVWNRTFKLNKKNHIFLHGQQWYVVLFFSVAI